MNKVSKLTKVSKQEFEDFLENYPNKLIRDKVRICEPPMSNFLDDSIQGDDRYFDIIVATIVHEWLKDGKTDDGDKFWEYSILAK